MITQQELRLNNWLSTPNGYKQVSYIGECIGFANESGGIDKYQHAPIISGDIRELEPILLTPDLLEKCGFDKENSRLRLFGETYLELDQDGDAFIVLIRQTNADHSIDMLLLRMEIQYLHQLQNLSHALTGEELTITL